MIARNRPATTLPASLILTTRELKHYRRYQCQTSTLPPKRQGFLPTAAEYADFQSWLAKRDSGYFSDTPLADITCYVKTAAEKKDEDGKATVCKHVLHPVHEHEADRCPVCTVEMHTAYMKVLTAALEEAGGLMKQRWEASEKDSPVLQAWYAGKLAFVNEIHRLETVAQNEEAYDNHQPQQQQQRRNNESTQTASETKTATQALQMHWASLQSSTTVVTPMRSTSTSTRTRTRTIVFGPGTRFERGRDSLYFWRRSPRYEAGKYASSSDDEDDQDADSECGEQEADKCASSSAAEDDDDDSDREEEEEEDTARGEKPLATCQATISRQADDGAQSDDDSDSEADSESDDEEYGDEQVKDAGDYIVFESDDEEEDEDVVEGAEFIVFE